MGKERGGSAGESLFRAKTRRHGDTLPRSCQTSDLYQQAHEDDQPQTEREEGAKAPEHRAPIPILPSFGHTARAGTLFLRRRLANNRARSGSWCMSAATNRGVSPSRWMPPRALKKDAALVGRRASSPLHCRNSVGRRNAASRYRGALDEPVFAKTAHMLRVLRQRLSGFDRTMSPLLTPSSLGRLSLSVVSWCVVML